MDDQMLKGLCKKFAAHFDCPIQLRDPDLWVMLDLPQRLRQHKAFAKRSQLVLAFHRDLLGSDTTAQLVTLGAPVVMAMAEALEMESQTGELRLEPKLDLPDSLPASISVVGGKLVFEDSRSVYRTIARVQFRAILDGAERTTEFFPVVLDGQKLTLADEELDAYLRASTGSRHDVEVDGKILGIQIQQLLEAAYDEAERRMQPLLRKWEQGATETAREEKGQALKFFAEQIGETLDRRAELEGFLELRLKEIDQRHSCSLDLSARNAVLFRIPLARVSCRYTNGKVNRPIVLDMDRITAKWLVPPCPNHPNLSLSRFGVCGTHGLVCEKCLWHCSGCQQSFCVGCPQAKCQSCSKVCGPCCLTLCSGCGQKVCSACSASCATGCGSVCPTCTVAVAGKKRCKNCAVMASCGHGVLKSKVKVCSVDGATFCNQRDCSKSLQGCAVCGGLACPHHSFVCAEEQELVCTECEAETLPDGRQACNRHATNCACGQVALNSELLPCSKHENSCPECRWFCVDCERAQCSDCEYVSCDECEEYHCVECAVNCSSCGEYVAKVHAGKCSSRCGPLCKACEVVVPITAAKKVRLCCKNCTVQCDCGHAALKESVGTCSSGHTLCATCSSELSTCGHCGQPCCSKHREVCTVMGETVCNSCGTGRLKDGSQACALHASQCSDCKAWTLKTDLKPCPTHPARLVCWTCQWNCGNCQTLHCCACSKANCKDCQRVLGQECQKFCQTCHAILCPGHTCSECGIPTCKSCERECSGCGTRLCSSCTKHSSVPCMLCRSLKPIQSHAALPSLSYWQWGDGISLLKDKPTLRVAQSKRRVVVEASFYFSVVTLSFVDGALLNRVEANKILGFRFGGKKK